MQLLQCREQDLVLPGHHGVAVLHRRHRAHRVGPSEARLIGLGDPPVGDLALPNKIRHHLGHRLGLHLGVHAVLEVQVDVVGLEPPEGALHRGADGLRPGVRDQGFIDRRAGLVEADAELGDDLDAGSDVPQGLPHQLLILMGIGGGAVGLGGVEQGIAQVIGGPDGADRLMFLRGRPVGVAESHTPQTHGRDRQIGA